MQVLHLLKSKVRDIFWPHFEESLDIKTLRELISKTYIWNSDYSKDHRPSYSMIREEVVRLRKVSQVGLIDAYSTIGFIPYTPPFNSMNQYHQIKVKDNKNQWFDMNLFLMVHMKDRCFYLLSAPLEPLV